MFAIGRRILLFIAVNFLIVITLSLIMNVLGVAPYLSARGISYPDLMLFCLVWGFGGAFISLAISRIMAKFAMGVKLVDPQTRQEDLRWLVETVYRLSRAAHLPKMPEVGVYESPEVNAFATGPTKSRALVAVSTGLLHRMNRDQVEGVLGHEVAHISNGDMVTMTLLQGVVNAFVMFFARVIAFALSQNVKEESRATVRFLTTFVLEIVLGILGMMVVAYFSRVREFRADAGGAGLAGRMKMVEALKGLARAIHGPADENTSASLATLKISGRKSGGFLALFSTHPPLEDRIRRLEGRQ